MRNTSTPRVRSAVTSSLMPCGSTGGQGLPEGRAWKGKAGRQALGVGDQGLHRMICPP